MSQKRILGLIQLFILSLGLVFRLQTQATLLPTVYQFKVDNQILFILEDPQDIQKAIDSYMQSFRLTIDPNAKITSMRTLQTIEVVPILNWNVKVNSIQDLYRYLSSTQEQSTQITIQEGDTLYDLAKTYTISMEEIMRLNPLLNPDLIHPGDTFTIKEANPIIDVEISLTNTIDETIPYQTETLTDTSLYTSDKVVVTKGTEGLKQVSYDITLLNGYLKSSQVRSEIIVTPAINQVVKVGTKVAQAKVTSGNFKVTTGTLQSGFGTRTHPITGVKTFHSGLDISNKLDTPVYAYADGTVIETDWDGQLGNTLAIDHGNGLVTKYGHLNSFTVSVGDVVTTSQQVATMGKSGYVTGVHLHFEVLQDGVYKNPLDYLN